MFQVDLKEELHFYQPTSFCEGQVIELNSKKTIVPWVRRQINALFSLKEEAEFPGSRPTVLTHEEFARITRVHENYQKQKKEQIMLAKPKSLFPYLITEKTDGKRMYLFFCKANHVCKFQVLIDSKFNMKLVSFKVKNEFYEGTLLDGELIQKKDKTYAFYVFDCLQCMGTPVQKNHFSDRLFIANKLIDMMDRVVSPLSSPFAILKKHFYPLENLPELLKSMKTLSHSSDGLIINQNNAVASCFHCPFTFKWKPFRFSSIDYLIVIREEKVYFYVKKNKEPCFIQSLKDTLKDCKKDDRKDRKDQKDGKDRKYSNMTCHSVLCVPPSHLDFQIVECFYCPHDKLWKPLKFRRDKQFPNSLHVLKETIKIMKKRIYLSDLVRAWKK